MPVAACMQPALSAGHADHLLLYTYVAVMTLSSTQQIALARLCPITRVCLREQAVMPVHDDQALRWSHRRVTQLQRPHAWRLCGCRWRVSLKLGVQGQDMTTAVPARLQGTALQLWPQTMLRA